MESYQALADIVKKIQNNTIPQTTTVTSPHDDRLWRYLHQKPINLLKHREEIEDWLDTAGLHNQIASALEQDAYQQAIATGNEMEFWPKLGHNARTSFVQWVTEHYTSDAPSWTLIKPVRLLSPRIMVHFTTAARQIAQEGFRFGTPDPDKLIVTSEWPTDMKPGGYCFAYDPSWEEIRRWIHGEMAGHDTVIFRASGVLIDHLNDAEKQIIFWGPSVQPDEIVALIRDETDQNAWNVVSERHTSADSPSNAFIAAA